MRNIDGQRATNGFSPSFFFVLLASRRPTLSLRSSTRIGGTADFEAETLSPTKAVEVIIVP